MRNCDDCEYEYGEWCVHPIILEEEEKDVGAGDLWGCDVTPEWCPRLRSAEKVTE